MSFFLTGQKPVWEKNRDNFNLRNGGIVIYSGSAQELVELRDRLGLPSLARFGWLPIRRGLMTGAVILPGIGGTKGYFVVAARNTVLKSAAETY